MLWKKASKSETRDIGIELFESLSKDIARDSSIEISGDRVVQLYGDKVPNPEDGLLGWVPGSKQSLKLLRLLVLGYMCLGLIGLRKPIHKWQKSLRTILKHGPEGLLRLKPRSRWNTSRLWIRRWRRFDQWP